MASPQAEELSRRYSAGLGSLRTAAAMGVLRAWDGLGGRDEADAERFVEAAAPLSDAAQRQSGALTDTYVALSVAAQTGTAVEPLGETVAARPGVDSQTVYRRPFVQAWAALGAGAPWHSAMAAARARAAQAAATDVMLAARNTASLAVQARPGITGYRRVLAGGKSCGLCIVASTRRYGRDNLMPIHTNCRCSVAPIAGDRYPEQVIDPERLQAVKREVEGGGSRSAYGRLRLDSGLLPSSVDPKALPDVEVVRHGEYGALLWNTRHDFTRLSA